MLEQRTDYALIIGIDHYPNFNSLTGAIADAMAFEKWVLDKDKGGGVPPEQCRLIISSPDPVRPIQDDIDDELEVIYNEIKNKSLEDIRRIYIFFSGHGLSNSRLGMDLCLGKWSYTRRRQALDANDYYEVVAGWGKFAEVVLLFDCCRVRQINAHGRECGLGTSRPDDKAGNDRRFVGFATDFQNAAMEAATGKGVNQNVHGHFTKALLEALWGAAATNEGGVPASKLKSYLLKRTSEIATEANQIQESEVLNGFPTENEPVFGSALPAFNVEIRFSSGRQGEMQLVGPDNKILRSGDVSSGPWRIGLSSGLHIIEDLTTGDIKPIRFEYQEGGQYVEF